MIENVELVQTRLAARARSHGTTPAGFIRRFAALCTRLHYFAVILRKGPSTTEPVTLTPFD
jgi:hypothetical protein